MRPNRPRNVGHARSPIVSRASLEALEHRQLLSRPSTISSAFEFETAPQRVKLQFDQNVGASLTANDLRVERVSASDGAPVSTSLAYDAGTNTATNAFGSVLADGNYRAALASEDVKNAGGESLNGDHVLDFYFLGADADRDRDVDLQDFNRYAANQGQSGRTFSQGDWNYDGQ